MRIPSFLSLGRALALGALVLSTASFAAEEKQPLNLSQQAVETFAKLKPLQETKDFAGMITLLNGLVPKLQPNSYDMAVVQDIRGRILFAQEKYNEAIGPLTDALKLGDANPDFLEMSKRLEILNMLSALHYQEGTNTKLPAAEQKRNSDLALGYLQRYIKNSKKITPETSMLYANMLYNKAIADPQHPDKELLRQMRAEVERGLYLSIAPKEGFYALLLAGLQQEQDYQHGAELLEFLVKNFPEKKDYWPTLLSFYLNMMNVNMESDPRTARTYNIRAINTIERAQKLGNLNTPKDNYNLVTLYINAGQYAKATEMLHAGLKNGTIESDVKTWNVLGSYYQQAEKPEKAIEAIQEAIKLFPTSGQLELVLGGIYRDIGKSREALDHFQAAVKKGNLDKPEAPLMLIAYTGYDLEEYEVALKAIEAVEKTPEGQKDQQLPHLKSAIQNLLKQREERKNRQGDTK